MESCAVASEAAELQAALDRGFWGFGDVKIDSGDVVIGVVEAPQET